MATEQIVIVSVRVGTAYFHAAVETGGLTGTLLRDMVSQCEGLVLPINEKVIKHIFMKMCFMTL